MASLVGSRVERKEDKKLLTGRGKYTADVTFAHQTYAYFVRSLTQERKSKTLIHQRLKNLQV